jgi:predicted RNA-binding protein YlqC (UPF0109 family)
MSAFDDEFGLFGDEETSEEERRSTLGARRIASDEAAHDDIEPEDERPRRVQRRPSSGAEGGGEPRRRWEPRGDRGPRKTADPAVAQQRAVDLLAFLARKLVTKPDEVIVEAIDTAKGPVIELEVHPDDLGKVIGRAGRVAMALRTLVRASAEGRISVDIVDVEDDDEFEQDLEHAGGTSATEGRSSGSGDADE